MKGSTIAFYILVAELCGIAVLAIATGAIAQTPAPAEDAAIVVEAPRALPLPAPAPAERSAYTGAPTATTIVRISALYGDLDLTQPAQAARLITRVERVARDACATLDRLYPLSPDPDCVSRAVTGARPAMDALVARATE